MKCLSVQQPWASLICSGIKDVENRSWRVNEAPGRILIHAGLKAQKIKEWPLFYAILLDNAIINGILPEIEEMPLGAIIGWADIVGFEEDSDSIWAGDKADHGSEWKWKIDKAGLFKEPIPYKGNRGLFDVPEVVEGNLPEFIELPEMRREGKILYIPVGKNTFEGIKENPNFSYYLTGDNLDLFLTDQGEEIPTDKIVFIESLTHEKLEMEVKDSWTQDELDEEGLPIIDFDPLSGEEISLVTINYEFKDLGRV